MTRPMTHVSGEGGAAQLFPFEYGKHLGGLMAGQIVSLSGCFQILGGVDDSMTRLVAGKRGSLWWRVGAFRLASHMTRTGPPGVPFFPPPPHQENASLQNLSCSLRFFSSATSRRPSCHIVLQLSGLWKRILNHLVRPKRFAPPFL